MIVLIQDSQGTSSVTVENIKTVVRAMVRRLSSESTDFNFAVATYATSRRISCFGDADQTISLINNEYQYGGSGLNRLNLALSKMVSKQLEKRRGDRKTDTAKVRFTFCSNCVISNKVSFFSYIYIFLFLSQNYVVEEQKLSARQQILDSKIDCSRGRYREVGV